ncbi:MAG: Gfo/Idh/MocA family oxidoreductase [Abditibacteriales bacterium]|nr:Gfo/Idh/MocA family oxidoreductase [Abditibacteriales bacterium]MDW8364593.1 Gfo/Idh/MocA family oxidoreductase [Abditibacteriales bacterium]
MADTLGVAIIGCGGMGRTHARLLAPQEDVHLRALVDVRLEAARALQEEVKAEYTTEDLERVLSDAGVDAVLICTHHHLHRPMCVAAAQAKKNIFVEKPLALTVEDCQAIRDAVNGAGVKLMVGFQARYSPFLLKLKEVIGAPLVIISQLIDPRWDDASWANDPIEGGGNVLSQGCHCFDATCFLAGSEPVSIYAQGGNFTHPNIPQITDSVACVIRFANGAVASVTIGDFGKPALMGKAAYQLFAGDRTGTLWNYYEREPQIKFWGVQPEAFTMDDLPETLRHAHGAHGYTQQMRAMVDWFAYDVDPVNAAKVDDGVRATQLGVLAIEAIRTGQAQPL